MKSPHRSIIGALLDVYDDIYSEWKMNQSSYY